MKANQSTYRWCSAVVGVLIWFGMGTVMAAQGGPGPTGGPLSSQQAAVEDLAVCYARATDTLGRAVDAVPVDPADLENTINIDMGNEKFIAALALYRRCLSKNFSFTLEFDLGFGLPPSTTPAPGSGPTDPQLQWANFVNNAFRNAHYRNTQHHMGSISSEIHGNTAHLVSYLIATHAFDETDQFNIDNGITGVSVVGGTYTDEVVREGGRWVILERTLLITSSEVTP